MPSKDTREFDVVEKVKVRVQALRIGMFVCELDRPWLETPFLFQGFELKTEADIAEVRKYCEYVYIDVLRTRVEQVAIDIDTPPPGSFRTAKKTEPFSQEIQTADTIRAETTDVVKRFVDNIRFGRSIDIQMARESVSECVSSVVRNPDAMVFMTQMRDKSELISQGAMNSCVYAIIVGRLLGLEGDQLANIGTCGLLHDLGMVSVPNELLNKPGKLTREETAIVREHAKVGHDLLAAGRNLYSGAVDVAYSHHEHLDGTGYPRGLTGKELSLNCKIVAAVEKYDALLSPRPYRPPYNHLDALNILNRMAKRNYLDGDVVNRFISYLGLYPPGSIVEMSNGEKAIVLETNEGQRLRPRILIVRDRESNPLARFVDLAHKKADDNGRPLTIKTVHEAGAFGINLLDYRKVVMKAHSGNIGE